ncbi:4-hydroxy-tetrahydrodipicolinate synthase [Alkaliphilus serpentinus]|uniref:4-hydroxy-tetrahydrodipicolinate synthase n=1 Tax=Alkaliphilus serpentinus TaxID=1482731 RepID=A0A833HMZ4_9FIRM|nr:4-hydroxy-tetrahydrodipicolinate synthase [Alkaliphilus serpentinus]KAB3529070.1 4-hydroxy-tetrahydrodipicolinate synthase [Alkaliphilus serpentinus]
MFNGSGVAIVTPFKEGQVDFQAFDRLLDLHLENDTQAIIVLGTTGEATTVNHEERVALIQAAVKKVAGRIPIVVGTGSNSTEIAINYTKEAEELGADAVLVVTPYYNKATQKGLITHFTAIANATKLPVILYNVPSRTGVNINAETVAALSEIENIIAVKEASGNISQILEIRRLVPADFKIYSGNDDQVVPIYSCGGNGVISVSANVVPRAMQRMCRAFEEGNVGEALELQLKYKKFIDLLFCEVNPIPVKAAVSIMGYIENELRLPLTQMEVANLEKLKKEMELQQII